MKKRMKEGEGEEKKVEKISLNRNCEAAKFWVTGLPLALIKLKVGRAII